MGCMSNDPLVKVAVATDRPLEQGLQVDVAAGVA